MILLLMIVLFKLFLPLTTHLITYLYHVSLKKRRKKEELIN